MNNLETAKLKLSDWVTNEGDRRLLQDEPIASFVEKIGLQVGESVAFHLLQAWQWRKVIIQASHIAEGGNGLTADDWRSLTGLQLIAAKPSKKKAGRNRRKSIKTSYDKKWLNVRYKALKNNDGRCELCGRAKGDGIILHVDHIKPKSKYPHLQYDLNNLQVLCDECNIGKSNKDDTDWRP